MDERSCTCGRPAGGKYGTRSITGRQPAPHQTGIILDPCATRAGVSPHFVSLSTCRAAPCLRFRTQHLRMTRDDGVIPFMSWSMHREPALGIRAYHSWFPPAFKAGGI